MFNDLYTYDADNDFYKEIGDLEDGLAQSNASGTYSDKANAHVTNNCTCVNPLIENETNDISAQNILKRIMSSANNPAPSPS